MKHFKKLILTVLSVCMILSARVAAENASAVVVGSATAYAGESVSIPVSFENNPGVASFTFGVEYDSECLQFDGYSYDTSVLPGMFETGKKINWLNTTDSYNNGVAFCLEFTVLDTAAVGETAVTVTYGEGDVCNMELEDIGFTVSAGSVNIAADGDVDSDGDLDADDLVELRKILLGISETVNTADVNRDNSIDIRDLVALKNLL